MQHLSALDILRSVILFILAGLAEIAGGYFVWIWLRDQRSLWIGIMGMLILIGYGILPTLQPISFTFGRVYAAYGGVFIALSLLWGWAVDGQAPDAPSIWGAALALLGAGIIIYWPRT